MPVVCWEADYVFKHDRWENRGPNNKLNDPDRIKKNIYRVLLTRGRDGMLIYIPKDKILNETFDLLINSGAKEI